MKFKIGDIVIGKNGGNKMTIFEIYSNRYSCIWCNDKTYQSFFNEDQLILADEFLKIEERNYKIDKIFE